MENQSTISGLPSHYSVMASNFFSLKTWRWLFCLALAAPAWGATPTALPNVELTGGLLYQIIASEFAYQRQEPALAYQTYMQMASTTKDPRLAQRAFQIADSVHAFKDAQKAGQLWAELAPNDADARLADLLASIRSGELTPSLQNTAKELLRSEKDAKKKQQIFQIIALQVDLGNATDQEALEFIRPLAEILSKKRQSRPLAGRRIWPGRSTEGCCGGRRLEHGIRIGPQYGQRSGQCRFRSSCGIFQTGTIQKSGNGRDTLSGN